MYKALKDWFMELSGADKILLVVSLIILINHKLALLAAFIVVVFFIYRLGAVLKDLHKTGGTEL